MSIPASAIRLAVLALVVIAASAHGQGYEVREANELLEAAPGDATTLDLGDDGAAAIALPFPAWIYGEPHDALVVSKYGWLQPGAQESFAESANPGAAHGQDATNSAFPYGRGAASADGIITPAWAPPVADSALPVRVRTWTSGTAPARRFVVTWDHGPSDGTPIRSEQVQFHEGPGRVVFAYDRAPVTGPEATGSFVCGIDERAGVRFVSPYRDGRGSGVQPATDLIFEPRTVHVNATDIGKEGEVPIWQDVRKESTVPDGCTKRCAYLARGRFYFSVPDRGVYFWHPKHGRKKHPPERRKKLLAEDRETFGGRFGDVQRWGRQVLDGKVLLLPADGGEPLRVWFRIVEYFTFDDRGTTSADFHTWNLRWILSNAFPGDDPREKIGRYYAWKAMATSRISVGKLFKAKQLDNSAKQYDSGRKNEYVLYSGRVRHGTRGPLATYAVADGERWSRFVLREDDQDVTQHVDRTPLRFVPDPHYVDGHYSYTVRARDNPYGWITGRTLPGLPMRDEGIDVDPGRTSGPETPR